MESNLLKESIKNLPHQAGIYIFRDRKNKPLYIGKASNLKNRLKSYLKTDDSRLQRMMLESEKIDFIKTGSDIEALILESQYIKRHQPPFNIMLRDDKQYGFVGFTHSTSSGQAEKYTKIFITHQPIKNQNSKIKNQNYNSKLKNLETRNWKLETDYTGPFTDISALKTTLRLLRRIFPYCTCRQLHNNYCLNYHIGKCLGFCCLKQQNPNLKLKNKNVKLYQKNIKAIKGILSGKKMSLIKQFEKEMQKLGKEHKFEAALELQYKIQKLKRVLKNAQIINEGRRVMIYHNYDWTLKLFQKYFDLPAFPHRIEAYDIANIQGQYAVGAMVVFTNGIPDKNQYRKFKIHMFRFTTSKHMGGDTGMLKEILTRRFNHPEWPSPDLILIDGGKAQLNAAKTTIYRGSTSIYCPVIALTKNEKHQGEKIFIQNNPSFAKASEGKEKPISLSQIPEAVKNLLLQIDSEAHRFAISYYRKLHQKKTLRS